jgi:ATP-dependent DNA helicase RecQ
VTEPTPERRRRRSRRGGRRRRRGGGSASVAGREAASAPAPEPEPKKRLAKPRRPRAKPVEFPPESREVAATAAEAALRLGIEKLHPEQEQVVADVLAQRDVLLVLPTGFGKSACYQVPSMLLPKPVVVASPLVALLQDQHLRLVAKGIRCVRLDGTVRGPARRAAMAEIAAGGPLLVMTTPETLSTTEAREALIASGVSLVAIDEAHCISEWGYDFRPEYRRLGQRVRELGAPPILALTATATPMVRDAIVRSLGMRDPAIVAASPHRSNLAFEVLRCEGDARFRALLRLARRLRRPGIIYCSTRGEVDAVYALLMRFGIPSHRYHGGMTGVERETEQEAFMSADERRTVMVATSAFGLGIDKSDIRFVMHFQSPASLEQYVQEAGRGGRDGRKANCILLYDGSDRAIHEGLLSRSRVRPDQLYKLGAALAAWAQEGREPNVQALAVSAELGPRIASALLTVLEEAGLVRFEGDKIQISGSAETLEQDARALAGQFETLRRQDARRLDALGDYAASDECRAIYLRRYFGEPDETPCELCDVCRGSPERPAAFFEPLVRPAQPQRRRRSRRGGHPQREGQREHDRGARPTPHRQPRPTVATAEPSADAGTVVAGEEVRKRRRRGRRGGRRRRGRREGGESGAPPEQPEG